MKKSPVSATAPQVRSSLLSVDMRKLVSRGDLHFAAPASMPEHGLPIGNGRMGSMLWTSPSALKLQINRVDVYASDSYSHSFHHRNEDYCGGCGLVDIDMVRGGSDVFPTAAPSGKAASQAVAQHLSIYDALASLRGKGLSVRALAWANDDVIAIEVTDNRARPEAISVALRMLRPPTVTTWNHKAVSTLAANDGQIMLVQEFREDNFHCKSAVAVEVIGRPVHVRQSHAQQMELVCPAKKGTFVVLIASSAMMKAGVDVVPAAEASLAKARDKGFEGLLADNRQWWHAFWTRSVVHLHSRDGQADALEANYNYFLYIMASCSRGSLTPKFNGLLWNCRGDKREWGAAHWWHNVRCHYSALMPADHMELADPMFNMYSNMSDACELAARQQWNSRGVYIPETVPFNGPERLPDAIATELAALNLLEKSWEDRSEAFIRFARSKHPHSSRWNWIRYHEWRQGTWICHDRKCGPFGAVTHILSTGPKIAYLFWQRYEFTGDLNWLRARAYPLLKGVAEFYRHFPNVRKGADGRYHIHHVNNHEGVWGCQDSLEELGAMRRGVPAGHPGGGDPPVGFRTSPAVAGIPGQPGAFPDHRSSRGSEPVDGGAHLGHRTEAGCESPGRYWRPGRLCRH
ncbi:MAG: hypothetical protein WC869_08940 [Phycisphaerae bacterium]|jgi:hypothetical protein